MGCEVNPGMGSRVWRLGGRGGDGTLGVASGHRSNCRAPDPRRQIPDPISRFMGEPFENSEAWKSARVLTNGVYALVRREPQARDFGLRDQLQRAAVSVMNNIAEGWESLHVAEKRQAYNIARRSCGEVRSMSYLLLDNKYVSAAEQDRPLSDCIQTGKLITGLIRSLGDRTQSPDPRPKI